MAYNDIENEDVLIQKALAGTELAYKTLYNAYKNSLFSICLRYMSSRQEAEDVLQDSFIKIFNELKQFDRGRGSFYTWASRITVNTNLEKIRKHKLHLESFENNPSIETLEHQYNVLANLELNDILKEIQKMPPGYRTVFNLYCIEGYNHQEIAEKLGISESTSKTQLMKSKIMMQSKVMKDLNIIR